MNSDQPAVARARAVAAPIPWFAAVTSATRPWRPASFIIPLVVRGYGGCGGAVPMADRITSQDTLEVVGEYPERPDLLFDVRAAVSLVGELDVVEVVALTLA